MGDRGELRKTQRPPKALATIEVSTSRAHRPDTNNYSVATSAAGIVAMKSSRKRGM